MFFFLGGIMYSIRVWCQSELVSIVLRLKGLKNINWCQCASKTIIGIGTGIGSRLV